jgi:methionine-rich copper-binding protein CopC
MSFKRFFAIPAFALAAVAASSAHAHARLEDSNPKPGSTVAAGPQTLRLAFNEALEPAFSKIAVLDSSDAAVAVQRVEIDKADQKVMLATVPQLHAGQYRVQWSTVTHDGHRTHGQFSFNVR